jgi:hypothetical protein
VDGLVTDWDALEALLYGALYGGMGWLAGEEGCLLTVEPIRTPRRDRERWAQLAFEKFNVSGFFTLDAPVAALYSVGRASGTVIDVGHDKTDVACVLEGGVVPSSLLRLASGGAAAEGVLAARLASRGVSLAGVDPLALRAAKQAIAQAAPSREAALEGMMGGEAPSSSSSPVSPFAFFPRLLLPATCCCCCLASRPSSVPASCEREDVRRCGRFFSWEGEVSS